MSAEEQILRELFSETDAPLREELPCGYTEHDMGRNDEVDALLDTRVVAVHTNFGDPVPTWPKPWPGTEDVGRWYELENGKIIGWVQDVPWQFLVRDAA